MCNSMSMIYIQSCRKTSSKCLVFATYIHLATFIHRMQVGQSFWAQHAEVQLEDQLSQNDAPLDLEVLLGAEARAYSKGLHYNPA